MTFKPDAYMFEHWEDMCTELMNCARMWGRKADSLDHSTTPAQREAFYEAYHNYSYAAYALRGAMLAEIEASRMEEGE